MNKFQQVFSHGHQMSLAVGVLTKYNVMILHAGVLGYIETIDEGIYHLNTSCDVYLTYH